MSRPSRSPRRSPASSWKAAGSARTTSAYVRPFPAVAGGCVQAVYWSRITWSLFQSASRNEGTFLARLRAWGTLTFDAPNKTMVTVSTAEAVMIDDMGIFRTTVEVAHLAVPDQRRHLHGVMVDTGSEYNWIPRPLLENLSIRTQRIDRFQTADGRLL